MTCKERLTQFFEENGVSYQAFHHRPAYTAQEIAAVEHVPGKFLAKVVMVAADGRTVMLVLPASSRVDLTKAGTLLGAKDVRLAKEQEFASLFPDCDVGAMPPFGNLYGVPIYVDKTLTDDPEFYFLAGTHEESLKIRYADYERLVKPTVGDFASHA